MGCDQQYLITYPRCWTSTRKGQAGKKAAAIERVLATERDPGDLWLAVQSGAAAISPCFREHGPFADALSPLTARGKRQESRHRFHRFTTSKRTPTSAWTGCARHGAAG
jgi:hypothetical protein